MNYLKSRTIWSVVALFLLGGFQNLEGMLPAEIFVLTTSILGALAVYFRAHPKVKFEK